MNSPTYTDAQVRELVNLWRIADTVSGKCTPFDVLRSCADQLEQALLAERKAAIQPQGEVLSASGLKALDRCCEELQRFIDMAVDYEIDEIGVQSFLTAIESMQLRKERSSTPQHVHVDGGDVCRTCGGSKVDPGGLPICRTCGDVRKPDGYTAILTDGKRYWADAPQTYGNWQPYFLGTPPAQMPVRSVSKSLQKAIALLDVTLRGTSAWAEVRAALEAFLKGGEGHE